MTAHRGRAVALGAGLGVLACAGPVVWILIRNPWFLDSPALAPLLGLPGAGLGALLGLLLSRWLGRVPFVAAATLLALGLAALPALSLAWPRPGPVPELRLLVVGVDGATWDLLDPMAARLPAFAALQERGVRAELQAAEPMFSPLLWTTLSTGKTPEQHGIHGFNVHADACRAARFWEIMEEAGLRTGIYKWLVTYPPARLSAFQVPAWLAPAPETWPADLSFVKEIELSRRLRRKQVAQRRGNLALVWDGAQHGLRLSTIAAAARFSIAERLDGPSPERAQRDGQLIRGWMDRDVFVWLLHRQRPAVASFTGYAIDAIGHRFWRYFQPQLFPEVPAAGVARWGDSLDLAYQQADAILGELLAQLPPEAHVVVLSDHGFQPLIADDSGMFFAPRTERLAARLTAEVGPVEVARLGHKVVVTPTGDDPALERERIASWLGRLEQGSTGEPFYRWEPVADDPRALGLTLVDEHVPGERLERDTVGGEPIADYVAPGETFSGVHERDGIFIAAGPDLGRGVRIDPLSQLSVTPILLALVGLPAAQDMVGEVPGAMFTRLPALGEGPESYDDLVARRELVGGEEGANEEQLRALGYIQ
ncbi:MAG: alkaline phosphatase family protein [Pseudomonadota bacterium]